MYRDQYIRHLVSSLTPSLVLGLRVTHLAARWVSIGVLFNPPYIVEIAWRKDHSMLVALPSSRRCITHPGRRRG